MNFSEVLRKALKITLYVRLAKPRQDLETPIALPTNA